MVCERHGKDNQLFIMKYLDRLFLDGITFIQTLKRVIIIGKRVGRGGHSLGTSHDHGGNTNKKILAISFILITVFMFVEAVGGFITNSLALISDAGHMLSDAVSLGLSLLAFKLGEKQANSDRTFGYKRFEILAAFINGVTLILISIYIFYEAYQRFSEPPEVASTGMLIIAVIGLLVNLVVAWIMMKGDTTANLNMKSAFLHVLSDMLGSIGAIIAALLIMFLGWNYADPIASVVVAVLIIISGWRVTKEAVSILMEGRPANIDFEDVNRTIMSFEDVVDIHDLHTWSITSGFPVLTCHLVVKQDVDRDALLKAVSSVIEEKFNIYHVTIQMEGELSGIQDVEKRLH